MSNGGFTQKDLPLDPFSQVYKNFCDILESDPALTKIVNAANFIRHDTVSQEPVPDNVQAGDLPQIRIIAADIAGPTNLTCNLARVIQAFEIQVTTGDNRLSNKLYPLKWALFRVLLDMEHKLALPFVNKVDASSPSISSDDDAELNRGLEGWSTVYRVEITQHHSRDKTS